MHANKKRLFFTFSIIFFMLVFMLVFGYAKKDRLYFNHYIKEFTRTRLSTNALDLHYTLKNPSEYGIYETTPFPLYEEHNSLSAYEELEKELSSLKKIDISCLSEEDAFTYNVLSDYLAESLALEKFPYYAEPLTPNSGIHTTLPILLAEYTFYSEKDIENYFKILENIPLYLDSVFLYEKEKALAGLFMNSVSLDKVVTACEEFATCDVITEHMLLSSFKERVSQLSLSSKEMQKYMQENQELLQHTVFPAYLSFADKLTSLSVYCNNSYWGLHSFENGKDYYQALLKRNTGSYRSIADIKEFLFADFEANYTQLFHLLSENPELLEADCLNRFDTSFPLSDAPLILAQLQSAIKQDFPTLPVSADVEVKSVSDSLEDYCSPAFYLTVPMDSYENNVIYLNKKNSLTGIDLYTTLAHEGFPGHLYQTVFFHSYNTVKNDTGVINYTSLLRNLLYYGGYTEGYALYVESLSYDYAAALCEEADIEDAKLICDVLKYEWQMQIGLYCLLDIAIHYDGATYEQVKAILNKFGILEEESTKAIYQYLLEEPTTYLKYYLGYLEIENLKNMAKSLWNDTYSDLKFHTFLLECGPCNFMRLEEKLLEE